MGQHAAVAGAGAPVEVADVAAQEEEPVAVEAAVEEEGAIVGKDCPAGMEANAAKFNSECKPCPPGKHKLFAGETMCTDCPGGHYGDDEGRTVPCEMCDVGTYSKPGSTECKAFTTCPSTAGVTVAGTPSSDEGMEFDTRDAPPSGGEYDPYPFDEYNDKDGDGICDGVAPLSFWKSHLEENS